MDPNTLEGKRFLWPKPILMRLINTPSKIAGGRSCQHDRFATAIGLFSETKCLPTVQPLCVVRPNCNRGKSRFLWSTGRQDV